MFELSGFLLAAVAVGVFVSFALSAAAGMGGSLVLVPTLAMVLGTKSGIAMAALLLALNNVGKLVAYRRHIRWRPALQLTLLTVAGAWLGAQLLVAVPEAWVAAAVIAAVVGSFLWERRSGAETRRTTGWTLGFLAGATSGFAGTSGPLKGVALRSLALPRQALVAAASIVSLAGDTTKVAVYASAGLIPPEFPVWALAAAPLMVVGVWFGRVFNHRIGEQHFTRLFWAVMGGYTLRLLMQ